MQIKEREKKGREKEKSCRDWLDIGLICRADSILAIAPHSERESDCGPGKLGAAEVKRRWFQMVPSVKASAARK